MKRVLCAFVFTAIGLPAQPVFTSADIPEIGYEAVLGADSSDEVPVNAGTTGGPQTWDFSPYVNDIEVPFEVIEVAGTPADTTFNGEADFVYHINHFPVPGQENMSLEWWQYFKIETEALMLVGEYRIITDTFTLRQLTDYDPDLINNPQPFQMGSAWSTSTYSKDTLDPNGFITLDTWKKASNEVDAWGTITVPKGAYQTLRYITYDTTITQLNIFVPGIPDTLATIQYTWVARKTGPVMILWSRDDEQNPEYDTAMVYVTLLSNNLPGVEEGVTVPSVPVKIVDRVLYFNLPESGYIRLDAYDALGRKEASLAEGFYASGQYSIALPNDFSSGVHFLKLNTPSSAICTKYVLLH
ncbi:hypothetical protein JXM67_06930 [candidate division WOR-3 bacterium]|nr:hypothetical protein [candidate division WOR-3 bacterium]